MPSVTPPNIRNDDTVNPLKDLDTTSPSKPFDPVNAVLPTELSQSPSTKNPPTLSQFVIAEPYNHLPIGHALDPAMLAMLQKGISVKN